MTRRLVIVRRFQASNNGRGLRQYNRGQVVAVTDMPADHTPAQWIEKGLARWSWWTVALVALWWVSA